MTLYFNNATTCKLNTEQLMASMSSSFVLTRFQFILYISVFCFFELLLILCPHYAVSKYCLTVSRNTRWTLYNQHDQSKATMVLVMLTLFETSTSACTWFMLMYRVSGLDIKRS